MARQPTPTLTADSIADALDRLRETTPLIHNITNYVVMNTTANALLAIGAAPAMVHAADEVEEFAGLASALVVNIGTLSSDWVASMKLAVTAANRRGLPWVLDPVAAGATAFRTETAATLARRGPAVVRANASEALAMAGAADALPRGVDSAHSSEEALERARAAAAELGTVMAITGATDQITDGRRLVTLANGHPMMTRVTGLGCTASALVAAMLGAGLPPFEAAVAGLAVLGVAGEVAALNAPGPGSLQLDLIDCLYRLDRETLRSRLVMTCDAPSISASIS